MRHISSVSAKVAAKKCNNARPAKPLEQEKTKIVIMFTKYCAVLLVATGLLLACCKKNDDINKPVIESHDGKIIASVVNGIEIGEYYSVITVKAMSLHYYDISELANRIIETADFVNGGFTMNLPETVSDEYLVRFSDFNQDSEISDPDAKVSMVAFHAYNDNGTWIETFEYRNNKMACARFWYTDRDFTYKLAYRNYSSSLKKGWNVEYVPSTGKKGIKGMTWYFSSSYVID